MGGKHKRHVNFYLEEDLVTRLDQIINDSNNIFDDRSKLIRFFIKQQLPVLEEELIKEQRK